MSSPLDGVIRGGPPPPPGRHWALSWFNLLVSNICLVLDICEKRNKLYFIGVCLCESWTVPSESWMTHCVSWTNRKTRCCELSSKENVTSTKYLLFIFINSLYLLSYFLSQTTGVCVCEICRACFSAYCWSLFLVVSITLVRGVDRLFVWRPTHDYWMILEVRTSNLRILKVILPCRWRALLGGGAACQLRTRTLRAVENVFGHPRLQCLHQPDTSSAKITDINRTAKFGILQTNSVE